MTRKTLKKATAVRVVVKGPRESRWNGKEEVRQRKRKEERNFEILKKRRKEGRKKEGRKNENTEANGRKAAATGTETAASSTGTAGTAGTAGAGAGAGAAAAAVFPPNWVTKISSLSG